MLADSFKHVLAPRNQGLWLILAFQSGFMNAGGFLACHKVVSHMTGYGTYVGVEAANKNYFTAFEMALAPFVFIAGAAYAGWLVDRRIIRKEEPKVVTGITVMAALNMAIYIGEISGYLGEFGEPLVLQRDFLLLFCLCFACGLQNGLFTGLTKGQVRTTHLTGPATDIGLNLTKIFSMERGDPERHQLSAMNWLRAKIAIMFSGGSLIAALTFPGLGHEGFAIPGAISLFLVWYVRRLLMISEGGVAGRSRRFGVLCGAVTGRPVADVAGVEGGGVAEHRERQAVRPVRDRDRCDLWRLVAGEEAGAVVDEVGVVHAESSAELEDRRAQLRRTGTGDRQVGRAFLCGVVT